MPIIGGILFFDKSTVYLKNYICHTAKDGLMHIFQDELKRLTADLEIEFRGMKISPMLRRVMKLILLFKRLSIYNHMVKQHSEVKHVHFELDVPHLNNPKFNDSSELQLFRIKL